MTDTRHSRLTWGQDIYNNRPSWYSFEKIFIKFFSGFLNLASYPDTNNKHVIKYDTLTPCISPLYWEDNRSNFLKVLFRLSGSCFLLSDIQIHITEMFIQENIQRPEYRETFPSSIQILWRKKQNEKTVTSSCKIVAKIGHDLP